MVMGKKQRVKIAGTIKLLSEKILSGEYELFSFHSSECTDRFFSPDDGTLIFKTTGECFLNISLRYMRKNLK